MNILGIESSCDDSSIAIVNSNKEIITNLLSSQIKDHLPYGGVVPELAARKHIDNLPILLEVAFEKAQISANEIDLFCATGGPGLIGGVVIGTTMAKTLASYFNKPYIAVNHLLGHALCARLTDNVEYPFLLLLASGGHSQFLLVKSSSEIKLLGETLDDAFGEAFDKVAKMLDLPYPGGPSLEKSALNGTSKYKFPLPLKRSNDCNFSLSGLKTSVRNAINSENLLSAQFISDISASFQSIIAEHILNKLAKAFSIYEQELGANAKKQFVFSGGVAANKFLRQKISDYCVKNNFDFTAPTQSLCTDNAAMIAWAGYEQFIAKGATSLDFEPRAKWPLY